METKSAVIPWPSRFSGIVLLLAILLTACAAPDDSTPEAQNELEPVSLKLSWQHSIQFLGFYIAQSNGYYADEGLDVTLEQLDDVAEGPLTPGRMVAGEFDFAIGREYARFAQSEGQLVTAIAAIYQFSAGAFFAHADSGITSPADLAGRTIVVKGEGWQRLLVGMLARDGLTLNDVEAVSGGFDMTPFLKGEVEVWAGFLTNEVIRARQQGLDLVTLPLYEYGLEENAVVIYTSQAMLASNPERVERFLRASLRGWQWAVENPSEAVDIMLEMFPEMAAERDFHLASFEASIPLIVPGGSRLGEIDCPTWNSSRLLADLESTEGLCTNNILEAVAE